MLVESQAGDVVWSNRMARTVVDDISKDWRASHLHERPEGDLFISGGRKFTIKNQTLAYEGEQATLYWFIPVVSSTEQERDPLTGLPSFGTFLRNLEDLWLEGKAHGFALGLLIIDLARFSVLNDVLGAEACDELLCQAANRFAKLIDEDCHLSRINGDQFVVATVGSLDVSDLHPKSVQAKSEALMHRIVNALQKPFESLGRTVNLRASVGMSTSALCDSPSELLAASHRALLGAKASPDSDWSVFNRDMLAAQTKQKALAKELAVAVDEGHLRLLFQPFVDLSDGSLIGAEALIRWDHPTHGLLRPDQFLDAAEVSNMMHPIGRWVVQKVVETAQSHPDLTFAMNLSAQQMLDPRFLPLLNGELEKRKVKPESIVIEILESSSSTTLDNITRVLQCVSDARIGLALDDADFDTKALALLSPLSLRYVKVDRQIVSSLHLDQTKMFCKAILALAGSLERKSLAVGVESLEQCRFLKQSGCHWGQGHFFAQPSPASEIKGWGKKPFLV